MRGRALGVLCLACVAWQAQAHAFLDHAEPRVGASVRAAPGEVKLWFSEVIEPAFSTVKVVDAKGQRVDKSDLHVDAANHALLRLSLGPLPPGGYTVVWRVVSPDTHVTQGDYSFRIVP